MKKKCMAFVLVIAMLIGLFAACGGEPAENLAGAPPLEEAENPPAANAGDAPEAEDGILQFSRALFREVLALDEENPVISPLSAYYVLSMAAFGAGGETLEEFSALLGREPMELAADLEALTRRLTDTAGSTTLQIAGSVWMAEDFPIVAAFNQAMADYFGAEAWARDFGAPETVDEINAWVYEQTAGLIDEMLSSISRDAVMLLFNTLYFSAQWAEQFNPMTAYQDIFHPENGEAREVTFLSSGTGTFPVSVTEQYEAVMLPYDDGRMGFLLVRPTDGSSVRDFAARHDLGQILAGLTETPEVQVRMPKLDLEFEILLNEVLIAMGLELAFGDMADFTGISEDDHSLYISTVLQKVRMLVDEEGTEAAAATMVQIERTSIALDMIELTFNTPYLFAVYDLQAGIPLFMGVLDNPA